MTQSSMHSLMFHAIQHVTTERLQKAVDSFVSSAYTITLTSHAEAEIRGFVTNGDGKEYGVVLSEGQTFCSCPDSMYRKGICKHAIVLALHAIRSSTLEEKATERKEELAEQPVNLRLSKVRKGFSFSA